MSKKIFSIFFTIFLAVSVVISPLTASAYEVTGFNITAKAGMLVSLDTGEIMYENNIDQKLYPASITKIMTAVIMLESEKYDPDGKVVMTESVQRMISGTGSAVSNISVGEEFTQRDLMYLVVMSSAGDCSLLAAEYYAGGVDQFVALMNAKAAELGLKNTHYTNPVGLHDPEHYTTVRDIYTLSKYALKNETFKTVYATNRYIMPATNKSGERTLSTTVFLQDPNTNYYYQYATGGKTGFTDEAGRCLMSTASYNGYNYMCILMNCPANADRRYEFLETADLYRWAFNNFSFREVANSTDPVCEVPVELSLETDFVPLYFEKPFVSVLPNEADDSTIVVKTHLPEKGIDAPVKKGDVIGTADIIYAEQVIGTVNLVAGNDVESSGLLTAFRYIKNFFSSIYMKALLMIIVLLILLFIIWCIRLNYARLKKRRVKYIPYGSKKGDGKHEH